MRSIPGLIIHPRRSWAVALLLATLGILIIGLWGQAERTPTADRLASRRCGQHDRR